MRTGLPRLAHASVSMAPIKSSVSELGHFLFSYAGSTALRDTSECEEPRGLPASRDRFPPRLGTRKRLGDMLPAKRKHVVKASEPRGVCCADHSRRFTGGQVRERGPYKTPSAINIYIEARAPNLEAC